MKKLLTSCQLDNFNPRKDGSITLRFITGEKNSQDVANIHSMIGTFGYMVFKPEEQLTKQEIEEIDSLDTEMFDNPKTKSQRLRGVLYRVWEQSESKTEFKDYYANELERIIIHYKDKLESI